MKPQFGTSQERFNSSYAPLCVVGQALWEGKVLEALRQTELISQKQSAHSPGEKLMDAFLLILAGYPSLYQLNNTLRSDPMVAQSWHRYPNLAEQSSISRTLDRCGSEALSGLRELSYQFWLNHTQLSRHDWRIPITLDLDLTPLLASKRSEASCKGYLGKKTKRATNWLGSWYIRIESHYSLSYIRVISSVVRV